MNLWLRLFATMLRAFCMRRVDPLSTTSMHARVMLNDLDFNGHVNNSRYLALADLARMDYFIRSGALRAALRLRAAPIVGDAYAKFRRELKPFERFEMQTRILGWDEKWAFIEHRFIRHGRTLGVVIIRGVFRSAQGVITPVRMLEAMGFDASQPSPELPAWLNTWHGSCEGLSESLRIEEQAALAG